MISNHEEDEFVAVRVQDPRIQHEGSWNSFVDYKIFLHTNSKAFTAKTSCVRRRYSEFVWLRKKLQKNAGLVPVPDLPGKSFFSFSNEDFLERRRKGLQVFLDKVVNMTVCLSDSQLHLFLQTQLPLGHIQDCVQGHTPYTVMDAILTYASSNRGLAQAQEDDSIKEPSLTVSYESMESPAPHQPSLQTNATYSPELLSCDTDPLEGLLERCDQDGHEEKSSVRISQKSNHLEAVVEDCGPAEASFYLGESLDDVDSVSSAEPIRQRSCQIQTPVEVHSPIGAGFEEEGVTTIDTEEQTVAHADSQEQKRGEMVNCEAEACVNSGAISDFTDNVRSQEEDVLEDVISEVNEGHVADDDSDGQTEPDNKKSDESGSIEVIPLQPELHDEALNVNGVPGEDVETVGGDAVEDMHQKNDEQAAGLVGTKDESDDDEEEEEEEEDSRSLASSNGSIVKVSDEESICDEAEDQIQAANGFMKTPPVDVARWAEVEASSRDILDLHMNGCPEEKEDENLRYVTNMSKSLDLNSTVADGDSTENSDFSVIESGCAAGLVDGKCSEQEALSSLSLDASEETQELEVR